MNMLYMLAHEQQQHGVAYVSVHKAAFNYMLEACSQAI